ncbi:MAG: trigger factor [Thermoleophilia bacterium]|nr:trigger factor [Thermoleophilia bacterium]
MGAMAQVEQLADDRVRLTIEVSPHDLHHAVEHAVADLAGSVKIPGFRKGKVPRQVLLANVGRDRLWAEAVESHIGGWFWSAAARARLRPVAAPEYDLGALPESQEAPWTFSATVAVQPLPTLVDWKTLQVPRPAATVPEELVAHELDAIRRSVAELVPADREARPGDTVVVDLVAPNGESQPDTVVELGSGRLVEEIEQGIVGGRAGDTQDISYELQDGSKATVTVTLKHVNEQVLPEPDDELARSATEFDTLAEWRVDVEQRILVALEEEIGVGFRGAAVDALVKASNVVAAGPLVEQRGRELIEGFVRSLQSRGIEPNAYFQMTGQTPDQLTARLYGEAAQSVARELALEALARDAGIEVSDDEVRALIREQAEAAGDDAEQVIADVWAHGHHESLREDLRLKAALDRLVREVTPVAPEVHEARQAIWTPDKEKEQTPKKELWVPGSASKESKKA